MDFDKFLDVRAVAETFGVSRATVWRWVAKNQFPRPVRLSPGTTRWSAAEIEKLIAFRRAQQEAE